MDKEQVGECPDNGCRKTCRHASDENLDRSVPASFSAPVIRALADLLFVHSSLPKESASLAALYTPITGILTSTHGVSHKNRAFLALMLCQRWDGELPPPH